MITKWNSFPQYVDFFQWFDNSGSMQRQFYKNRSTCSPGHLASTIDKNSRKSFARFCKRRACRFVVFFLIQLTSRLSNPLLCYPHAKKGSESWFCWMLKVSFFRNDILQSFFQCEQMLTRRKYQKRYYSYRSWRWSSWIFKKAWNFATGVQSTSLYLRRTIGSGNQGCFLCGNTDSAKLP